MKIALIEPFMTGSHAAWANEYQASSGHAVQIFGMEGQYWKWRMHGGAVTLAREFLASGMKPDLILATDMLDLTSFLALTRRVTADIPVALYMHENQLSYPWSPTDADPALQRDAHYCFINYASALAADAVLFNSDFHREGFLAELPVFLKTFPDHKELAGLDLIAEKCQTLHLGLDLKKFDSCRIETKAGGPPLLLWNHRWEYDKNPDDFFNALFALQDRGVAFEVAVLGESYKKQPPIFAEARERLGERIVHWGYADSFAAYASWLWRADILPVTSIHDFFGISVVEAIYCGCYPFLPQRLAYPEHLPETLHQHCFYSEDDSLVDRLATLCLDVESTRNSCFSEFVERYDWTHSARHYDDLFEQLAFQRKSG